MYSNAIVLPNWISIIPRILLFPEFHILKFHISRNSKSQQYGMFLFVEFHTSLISGGKLYLLWNYVTIMEW